MHHRKLLSIFTVMATSFTLAAKSPSILPAALSYKQRQAAIASLLDWKDTSDGTLCSGHYKQPKRLDGVTAPSGLNQTTTITSKGPNFLKLNGKSTLKNNIIVKQPGREVHADLAHITRNKAGEITRIELTGNVHLYENGKHVVTDHLTIQLPSQAIRATTVVYHISNLKKTNPNLLESWGTARSVQQDRPGVSTYDGASYSTCRPSDPIWSIQASKLKLDQNEGIGTIHNGVLKVKGIPVLPLPYLQFPIDGRRRSGILAPSYAHQSTKNLTGQGSTQNYIFTLPLYLNLAPNYDDLMTFNWWTKRGLVLDNQFRYLNRYLKSTVDIDWVPHDSLANDERNYGTSTVNSNTFYTAAVKAHYLTGLNDLKSDRWHIALAADVDFSERWKANLRINAVSDNYYFRDYSMTDSSAYNLLRSNLSLHYSGNHWQDNLLVESYQALHRFDQLDYNVDTPYSRQPELTFTGFYGNWLQSPLDLSLTGQFDNFLYQDSFNTTMPQGDREHIRAALSYPIYLRGGSITPSVYADLRGYQLTKNTAGFNRDKNYAIPIVNLDSQWTWARPFHLFSRQLRNEFQIHAYYLYVPTVDQSDSPNFDSYLLPYSYAQLFTVNRYTGYDKLSNANQLSLGVHEGWIDPATGIELASLNAGIANSFDTSKVCLTPSCSLPLTHLSPLVTELHLSLAQHWSFTGSAAWNLDRGNAVNNVNSGFQYNSGGQGLFSINYTYAPEAVNTVPQTFWLPTGVSNNLTVGGELPLSDRFRLLGYVTHDFAYDRSNLGFIGIEYDACCWRLKLVYRRLWDSALYASDGTVAKNTYKGRIMLTLELRGLGSAGTLGDRSAMKSVLQNIPGYDPKH